MLDRGFYYAYFGKDQLLILATYFKLLEYIVYLCEWVLP